MSHTQSRRPGPFPQSFRRKTRENFPPTAPTLVLPVPATATRGFAEGNTLFDPRARPQRLEGVGYSYPWPTIDSALSDILS